MRPTTPNCNFAGQAGPSSPPPTPTIAAAFSFKNRRNVVHLSREHLSSRDGTITPNGNGPNFFYTPSNRPADLSPRSSSPNISVHEPSSAGNSRRSFISETNTPIVEAPPRRQRGRHALGNFTVEEFNESDYEDWESGDEVIRPHQYEDAESEKAMSVKSVSHKDLDPHILDRFNDLNCEEDNRQAWLQALRAEKRRKRRSSSSVQKRTISMSIGSDTDDEDLQPVTLEANDAGSSARRLRRKTVGTSLIFDDPPPRIDEEDEDEITEMHEDQHFGDDYAMRELPYYIQQDMEVDTSGEE